MAEPCPYPPNVFGDCVDASQTPPYNLGSNCRTECCPPCSNADNCCASCLSNSWGRSRSCLSYVHDPCPGNGARIQFLNQWGRWVLKKTRDDGSPWGQQTVPNDSNCNFNAFPPAGCKKGDGERACVPQLNTFGSTDPLLWADYLLASAAGYPYAGFTVPRNCSGCRCQGLTCDECDCVFEAESSSSTSSSSNSPASAIGISIIEDE